MSLLPALTFRSKDQNLYATVAQLQALSTSLSTVNVSTATGAGVSVSEPSPNNFVFTNALSNSGGLAFVSVPGSSTLGLSNAGVLGLVAGSGIGVSGATGNITVSNNGVLSLTAGSNVSLGGTASAPVVNANLPIGQTNLAFGALPAGSADGPGFSAITFPLYGGFNVPVVAGGLYMLQGAYAFTCTGGGYTISLTIINPGAPDIEILNDDNSASYTITSALYDVGVPFSAMFIANTNYIQMNLANGASAGTNGTIVNLDPLYLTRIA